MGGLSTMDESRWVTPRMLLQLVFCCVVTGGRDI